jgi:hypothetical protein
MQAEIIALRHQLTVLQRSQKPKRLVLNRCDRCLWVWLSRLWSGLAFLLNHRQTRNRDWLASSRISLVLDC